MSAESLPRNPGMPLDVASAREPRINQSATERRAASLPARRSIKKEWQAAWLLRAITLIDLTTLAGDDTPTNVARLCAKARQPLRHDLLEALDMTDTKLTTGAVCVYHQRVADAVAALHGSGVPVAAVSTGFPAGLSPLPQRLAEIRASVAAGGREIDIVISREHVLSNNWAALYDETRAMREACGDSLMKTILATGELGTLRNVYSASMVTMMAGSDFIKTSTGKEDVNATLEFGLVMCRAIRHYHTLSGHSVGFKPAGGIRTAKQALSWLALMKDELGDAWTQPRLFRIGASGLLTDIERQISHYVTGRYAARHHMPMV
jgi:deoxyribose-phosphate aldolase